MAPTNKFAYRPDIDGLRAIAVLAVVAFHTGLPGVPGGFVGVDIFFVISGFLITGLLLQDLENFGRIQFLSFYARRVRRILPVLILAVLATVFGSFLTFELGVVKRVSATGVATLLMASNLYFLHISQDYFAIRTEFQPLLHTWSLGVEEQFYLVWPATMAVVWRLCSGKRMHVAAALGIFALASAACAIGFGWWNTAWAFYTPVARAWELSIGALIAICLPWLELLPSVLARTAALLGLALVGAGLAFVIPGGLFPAVLIPVVGTAFVIVGNIKSRNWLVCRLLSTKLMVTIGLASYGWYLLHWPVLSIMRIRAAGEPDLVRDCCLSLATLVVALATLHGFERPLRFYIGSKAPAARVVAVGSVATLTAVTIAFGAWILAKSSPRSVMETELLRAKGDTFPKADRCLLPVGSNISVPTECLAVGPRIVLWGDSLANRLAPALVQWSENHQSSIEILTKASCPPVWHALPTEPDVGSWKGYYGCRSFNDLAMDRMSIAADLPNSGILLAGAWWPRATDIDLTKLAGSSEPRHSFDVSASTTDESLSALERFMRGTLREITARKLRVVLVLQTPLLMTDRGPASRLVDAPDCLFWRAARDCSMSLLTHQRVSWQTNHVLEKVAAEFAEARVLDPADLICKDNVCPALANGITVYTDFGHLSATMSRSLASPLTPYLSWLTEDR